MNVKDLKEALEEYADTDEITVFGQQHVRYDLVNVIPGKGGRPVLIYDLKEAWL